MSCWFKRIIFSKCLFSLVLGTYSEKYAFQVPMQYQKKDGESLQQVLGIKPGQTIEAAIDEFCTIPDVHDFCSQEGIKSTLISQVRPVLDDFGAKHFVNGLLRDIFTNRRVQEANSSLERVMYRELDSNIDPASGRILYDLVMDNAQVRRSLEIGMAYGVSSLYLAQALVDSKREGIAHVSIDPFQSTEWGSIGVANLQRASLSHISKLYEMPSYLALPDMVKSKHEYDVVFIDGMHTFDFTLVDFFFSDLLLPVSGFLILDDLQMPAVTKVKDYITKNRAYKRIEIKHPQVSKRIAIFQKTGHDSKKWDFHVEF